MEPPQWHEEELSRVFLDDRDRLVTMGLIRPTDPTSYTECPHCGPGSMGRVHPLVNRRASRTAFWLPCRECGLVEIPADALRRWQLDLPAFAGAVAQAAGVRGEPQSFADDRGWFLGRATWAKRSHEVFLVRAVFGEAVPALRQRLDRHPKAVVLAATSEDALALGPHAGDRRVVDLGAILTFDGELRCDVAVLDDMLQPEPVSAKVTGPRPAARKAMLLTKIDRLKQELIAHIRAAKRYAYDQEDCSGEPRLLERPSKSKLGQLAGLKPYEVTRCFEDEAGRELVLLWDVADDLNQIMRYGG